MRRYVLAAAAAAAAVLPGCGKSVKLVPAAGVLKINGKPAANVNVQFMPDSARGATGPTSYATTGPDGAFALKTYDGQDGAVVGPHQIMLADLDEERPPQGRPPKNPPRLDTKYSIPGQGLTADVTEGGGPIQLNATGPAR